MYFWFSDNFPDKYMMICVKNIWRFRFGWDNITILIILHFRLLNLWWVEYIMSDTLVNSEYLSLDKFMALAAVNVPHDLGIVTVNMRLIIVIITNVTPGLDKFTNVHTSCTSEVLQKLC